MGCLKPLRTTKNIVIKKLKKNMKVTNIIWETDGEDVELPNEMEIPNSVDEEEIADYLSDETGWLVNSFKIEY